jgi:hypothetical protein
MKNRLNPSMSLTEQMKAIMQSTIQKGTIPQHLVFASTLMLVELTDAFRSIILNADIYEEEDFSVSTFNIASFQPCDEGFVMRVGHDVLRIIKQESSSMEQPDHQNAVEAISLILGFQMDFMTLSLHWPNSLERKSGQRWNLPRG